jgi:hypothetical protein
MWQCLVLHFTIYEGVSKIFRTDAVNITKLTMKPIGRNHPLRSFLPYVNTGPTVSCIFGTLPGNPFRSVSSTLCDSAWILSVVSNRRHFSFSLIFGNRKKSRGAKWGEYGGWGMTAIFVSPETAGWGRNWETGRYHGEATMSILAKVRGDVFASFHAVAVKRRSRTRNSVFGLLGPVLRATTTAV